MAEVERSLPFALLSPIPPESVWEPEVDPRDVLESPTMGDVLVLGKELSTAATVAIDFETKGTRTWTKEDRIVGVGFAWSGSDGIGCRYVAVTEEEATHLAVRALSFIPKGATVLAHNVNFDGAWAAESARRVGERPDFDCTRSPLVSWTHCTYGLYKQLASEGWEGQAWNLKAAMKDLLGWRNTNEIDRDEWLLSHGFHKQGPRLKGDESPDAHRAAIRRWLSKGGKRRVAPDLAEMWRVPPAILGRYCILDCLATLDLYQRVLRPALDRFPELEDYHCGPWLHVNLLLAEQQWFGIRCDRDRLRAHGFDCLHRAEEAEAEIRRSPILGPIVADIEQSRREVARKAIIEKEPKRYKKNGEESKAWAQWLERVERPTFKEWSPASGDDLRQLLYQSGLVQVEEPEKDPDGFVLHGVNGPVRLDRTDTGLLAVDSNAMAQLPPEIGGPVDRFIDAAKEASIVDSYLKHIYDHTASRGSGIGGGIRLHAGWIVPRTLTGRLGGKDPNLQAVPKSLEFLDCFGPDPGCVWLEEDAAAVEPHVLAELSQDRALLDLYGPDANPNHDRYLYTLASIPHPSFDAVRRHYSVEAPTKEGVKAAKSECKALRELGKVLVLAGDYGAGAKKKWRTCLLKGIRISLKEMEEIHAGQRALHSGVDAWRASLEREWDARGGWVLSGLGFPTPVFHDKLKDVVNRVVQRTGHDIHVIHVWQLESLLTAAGIGSTGVVWDFHDQDISQVREEDAERALAVAVEAVDELNRYLGGSVRIKYGPRIVRSLSEAKMEEAWEARRKAEEGQR